MRPLIAALLDHAFPPVCLACAAPIGPRSMGAAHPCRAADLVCPECTALLLPHNPADICLRCGFPGKIYDGHVGCSECKHLTESFNTARSAWPYQSPAGEMVRNLKYKKSPWMAEHLVDLSEPILGDWIREQLEGVLIVPIPLATLRWIVRGYNQAQEIAIAMGRLYHLDVIPEDDFQRLIFHGPQARSGRREERLENIKGAFHVRKTGRLADRHVLLVDDVMTTGATAHEAARVLLAAGATRVDVITITRALLGQDRLSMAEE